MQEIRVWAPLVESLEVDIAGNHLPMVKDRHGWWEVDSTQVEPGTDYSFSVDGSNPLPDPRSMRQPQGVHGPSQTVDHSLFPWTDAHWQPAPLSSAIIYELHIGTFSPEGTCDGVIEHLDHLFDLGITHVELMPVNAFSGMRGWGYDGVSLFAPHEAYGGPDGLKRLVDACHKAGLAVILDVVYNHLGPEGNYLERFAPYFTERHVSPWGKAVNFDSEYSDEVRRFFCDNALMWLRDYHIDALRLDAIHAIIDTSATHILEQLANEVDSLEAELGKHKTLIAESDLNDPRIIRPRSVGGYGMDAQWSDDFHHALHTVLTGETKGYYADFGALSDLSRSITNAFVYDGKYSAYRKRVHGRRPDGLSGHKFLGYIQNHDQVGNRAQGDRISQLVNIGRQKIAAALVLTSPFIPMLFQGEEWGASTPFQYFTNHQDKQLGEAVREGRRSEFASFGWHKEEIPDPQDVSTFNRSKLNWEELQQPPHRDLYEWYRKLIWLRKQFSCLTNGRLDQVSVQYDVDANWLLVGRNEISVVVNLHRTGQMVPLPQRTSTSMVLLASDHSVDLGADGIVLPADSVAVIAHC